MSITHGVECTSCGADFEVDHADELAAVTCVSCGLPVCGRLSCRHVGPDRRVFCARCAGMPLPPALPPTKRKRGK